MQAGERARLFPGPEPTAPPTNWLPAGGSSSGRVSSISKLLCPSVSDGARTILEELFAAVKAFNQERLLKGEQTINPGFGTPGRQQDAAEYVHGRGCVCAFFSQGLSWRNSALVDFPKKRYFDSLCDALLQEVKDVRAGAGFEKPQVQIDTGLVQRCFQFEATRERCCQRCGDSTTTRVLETSLKVACGALSGVTMEDLLTCHFMAKSVEFACECGHNMSTERTWITKPPAVLVVQLKRFGVSHTCSALCLAPALFCSTAVTLLYSLFACTFGLHSQCIRNL